MVSRYWPYKTRWGWIVGLSAVRGDDCATVLTKKGAEDWAACLNARHVADEETATKERARADRAERALREIRDADPVDMALDPNWPARIAGAALDG